ncbi:MAG: hypothetical protein GX947_05680, partial [Tissierellia bacterium]|nr:hypothetical protein [Tissierellia bacterium]
MEKQLVTLDITPFLVEALVTKQRLHKDIEKIYRQNKYRYYSLAKKSPLYNHHIMTQGSIYTEEYSRKLLGIFLSATEKEQDTDHILTLIEAAFPVVYNYVRKVANEIDLNEIIKRVYYPEMSDDEFNGSLTIAYWLARFFDKKLVHNESLERLQEMWQLRIKSYDGTGFQLFSYDVLPKDDINKAKILLGRLEEHLDASMSTPWFYLQMGNEEAKSYANQLSLIYDSECLSLATILEEVKFTKKDFIELGAIYWSHNKNMNRTEGSKFIIAGSMIKGLLKAYKQAKDYYFKNNRESTFLEMEGMEREIKRLKDQERFRERQAEALMAENRRIRNEYKSTLEAKINEQEKEIKNLKIKLYHEQEKNKELFALRNLVFSLEYEEEIHEDEQLTILEVKAIIIGGHERWQARLREELPKTFSFVGADQKNFDTNKLHNVE